MSDLASLLRNLQGGQRPVGGGPTINTGGFVTPTSPWTNNSAVSQGAPNNQNSQGTGNNLSSMLRNGQKIYNSFGQSSPTGSLYGSGSGLSAEGMGAVGTSPDGSAIGSLYGSGGLSSAGAGTGVSADGSAMGSLYGAGSGLGAGEGISGAGGTGISGAGAEGAGSGLLAFWPAAVAAAAYANESSARGGGARDPNTGHYLRDIATGEVMNQDNKKRWGPGIKKVFGDGAVSSGFSQDAIGSGQLGSGDIRGWAGNLHNGAGPKALSGFVKLLRF